MKPFNLNNESKITPGFTTPENYFDDFNRRIMQQLPQREVKVVPLYKKMPVWIAAVAAIFIVALSMSIWFRMDATTQPDDSAIENYLVYQANINSYDLMQNLNEKDIAEIEQTITLNDDAIESYLSEQDGYNTYLNN